MQPPSSLPADRTTDRTHAKWRARAVEKEEDGDEDEGATSEWKEDEPSRQKGR